LQPTVGEWTIMRSIYLRFTRTTGSDGLQARTCQDVALIGRKLESIRLQNYLQEREWNALRFFEPSSCQPNPHRQQTNGKGPE
jgi:hypothetical protein